MVLLAVFSRVVPHPANFTALAGISLFAGFRFRHRYEAYLIPVLSYLVSDIVFVMLGKVGFYGITQVFVYLSMCIVTFAGTRLRKITFGRVFIFSLISSFFFWMISNFGVWVGSAVNGINDANSSLLATYLIALPFYSRVSTELFFNALLGNLFYSFFCFIPYLLNRGSHKTVTAPSVQQAGI